METLPAKFKNTADFAAANHGHCDFCSAELQHFSSKLSKAPKAKAAGHLQCLKVLEIFFVSHIHYINPYNHYDNVWE